MDRVVVRRGSTLPEKVADGSECVGSACKRKARLPVAQFQEVVGLRKLFEPSAVLDGTGDLGAVATRRQESFCHVIKRLHLGKCNGPVWNRIAPLFFQLVQLSGGLEMGPKPEVDGQRPI